MYYDRVPTPELRALLRPGGALRWLAELALANPGMHLQFRRSRGDRAHGSVQLYLGRTSPLEVVARPSGRFRLSAHATYRALAPELFAGDLVAADLTASRGPLERYLRRVEEGAATAFTDGEARAQVGLLRRYGPFARQGDPFVALDAEVVVGFDSRPERARYEAAARAELGLFATHRELDVLGVLADGAVALVELKAPGADLDVAIAQAASHVHRFARMHLGWERRGVEALARAKHEAGLLPFAPAVASPPRLVPVVAAPDLPSAWRPARPVLAAGVRLWELDEQGTIVAERAA